jgi:polar amino acid transport system permease protein
MNWALKWETFISKISYNNYDNTFMTMLGNGLLTTVKIAVFGLLIGIVLGTLIAAVKVAPKYKWFIKFLDKVCAVYTAFFRGTPIMVQLLLAYYVLLPMMGITGVDPEMVGIIVFGLNSGAYVSESIRAGILSVDVGQTEAGRALGLSNGVTMMKIVIPQAIKNVIPTIGNEMIALIKETSIVSMIGMYDLTAAAKNIGAGHNLASYIAPMTVAALFYLAIVYALTFVVKKLERRLRSGDKR